MRIERFEELKSWQEARTLNQMVGRFIDTPAFARNRRLGWQIEEAAASIMSNIAEAHGRYSFEDKRRILDIAMGSCKEVQSRLYAALDRRYIVVQEEFDQAYEQGDIVSQLLGGALQNLDRQICDRLGVRSPVRRKAEA